MDGHACHVTGSLGAGCYVEEVSCTHYSPTLNSSFIENAVSGWATARFDGVVYGHAFLCEFT